MSIINRIFLAASSSLIREIESSMSNPFALQRECFENLMAHSAKTAYGKMVGIDALAKSGHSYKERLREFQSRVPIMEYDAFVPYIERMRKGERNVLWDEPTKWFAKSSGTSSQKSKFIPVTPASLKLTHYGGFRRMLAWYIHTHPQSRIFCGKALTLGGSVQVDGLDGGRAKSGDLSAILLSNSPALVESLRTPSRKSALMGDFNKKLEAICRECSSQNVTNFAGVPSWNLMLINKLLEYNGCSNLLEIWPNMELFMHGGIGFDPYREIYKTLIPSGNMHYLENYNASEGYFAFQDNLDFDGMLLTVGNGVFYEFVPLPQLPDFLSGAKCRAATLEEVELGVDYALVISSVNGLFRYLIGDCVKFVSLLPHRIKVSGRTKLSINAFGEELMIGNAERALAEACRRCNCTVTDFTVAPLFMEALQSGSSFTKGRHRWVVEFGRAPQDLDAFARELDYQLTQQNSDYEAKRAGNATMEQLELIEVPKGSFERWMGSRGKLGGQNKVPRLYHNQDYIESLLNYLHQ